MQRLSGLLVIIAIVFGVRAYMGHDAEKRVVAAQEMYEDGEYDAALAELRTLHRWHSWTDAYLNEGEALREKVRQRRVEERQRSQEEAEELEFQRQWEEEMAEEEERLRQERRTEEYQEAVRQRRLGRRGQ